MKKLFLIVFSIIGILSCTEEEKTRKSVYVLEETTPMVNSLDNYKIVKVIKDGVEISRFENTAACDICISDNQDVYVLGRTLVDEKKVSFLWKNGVATRIDDFYASTIFTNKNKLYVSGNDVYAVGGSELYNDGFVPVLWKNGVTTELQYSPVQYNIVNSIHLAGEKKYTFGVNFDHPNGTLFWENGIEKYLEDNDGILSFVSVQQSNGNIYFLGSKYFANTEKSKIVYYKNGEEFTVSNPLDNCKPTSFFISGNDIYIAGLKYKGDMLVATLWKNGIEQKLSNIGSIAFSVYVDNSDVYVAGVEDNKGVLWKNGIKIIEKSSETSYTRFGAVIVK